MVSIHTPTKGVTKDAVQETFYNDVSIHTPTKGVTQKTIKSDFFSLVSIHTPTKGVTGFSDCSYPPIMFQSTHPRRV